MVYGHLRDGQIENGFRGGRRGAAFVGQPSEADQAAEEAVRRAAGATAASPGNDPRLTSDFRQALLHAFDAREGPLGCKHLVRHSKFQL